MSYENCRCSRMADAGDMAPRLWECDEHGKTGFAAFDLIFQQQTIFTGHSDFLKKEARDDFWLFCMGVKMIKVAEAKMMGDIYFDEDHLWNDVRKELDRIARKAKRATVRAEGKVAGVMSTRAFGVPDHPQVLADAPKAPPPAVKQGWFDRLFRSA